MLSKERVLEVLKEAGVVDAGGQGLICIVEGALKALLNEELGVELEIKPSNLDKFVDDSHMKPEDITFGYCTEFIIQEADEVDESDLREYLNTLGDSVVVVEHAQHEAQVRVLVGLRERLHGLRPHLHACPLLLGEVARQEVGHDQRGHGYQYCRGHEENLHLPYPVRPLHNILINGLKAGFIASQEVKVWLAKWGRGEQ